MTDQSPESALAECMALSEKATPGEWEMPAGPSRVSDIFEAGDWNVCPPLGEAGPVCIAAGEDNAAFLTAAVNLIRTHGAHFAALAAEVERLRNKNAEFLAAWGNSIARAELAESERDAVVRALRRFVADAQNVDLGGGDAVVTTCESLEMAQAAIAAMGKGEG